jgi:ribosomal protein S27E
MPSAGGDGLGNNEAHSWSDGFSFRDGLFMSMDEKPQQTSQGYWVRKRCDDCGTPVIIVSEDGTFCLLRCSLCGKEYRFYLRA